MDNTVRDLLINDVNDVLKDFFEYVPLDTSIKVADKLYNKGWVKKVQTKSIKINIPAKNTAYWEIWGGWRGNHDHRIDNATCSCCGYTHSTVFALNQLNKICPRCESKMKVKEV